MTELNYSTFDEGNQPPGLVIKRERNKCTLVFLGILVLVFVIISLVFVILFVRERYIDVVEPSNVCPSFHEWTTDCCPEQKCSKNWTQNPLVVFSFDGFRADYLKRGLMPTVEKLINCGSHAPFMYSSYPSKTFPNHYTLMTGLYPESHGIIENHMYDPKADPGHPYFKKSSPNPNWWKGEPFWNTVVKNGGKSAVLLWPGSQVEIGGLRPTYWLPYTKPPFFDEISQVMDWLLLNDSSRPEFIAAYFNQPDKAGHEFGPKSSQINDQLMLLDSVVEHFLTELNKNDLHGCINLLIVADHGMQSYNNKSVVISDYINTDDMIVFEAVVGQIHLMNKSDAQAEVVQNLTCQMNDSYRVYTEDNMPRRFHYTKSDRIGDIILDTNPGYYVFNHKPAERQWGVADHGYDYHYKSLHTLFLGYGPQIRPNYTLENDNIGSFENVELYGLMADILNISKRAPNNGTVGSLRKILKNTQSLFRNHPSALDKHWPDIPKSDFHQNSYCNLTSGEVRSVKRSSPLDLNYAPLFASINTPESINITQIPSGYTTGNILFSNTLSKRRGVPLMVQRKIDGNEQLITGVDEVRIGSDMNCKVLAEESRKMRGKGFIWSDLDGFSNSLDNTPSFQQMSWMRQGFHDGIWKTLRSKFKQSFWLITGPIFDIDNGKKTLQEVYSIVESQDPPIATHYYLILIKCPSGWSDDLTKCKDAQAMSFILPNVDRRVNFCQGDDNYLKENLVRVKDIENLTGLIFFTNWPKEEAMRLRITLNQELWI